MDPRGSREGGPPLPHTLIVVGIVCLFYGFVFIFFFTLAALNKEACFLQTVC